MTYRSPYDQAKALEAQINAVLSVIDADASPIEERKIITLLKRQIVDARLDIRDYDYADTRVEQSRHGEEARKRLEQLEILIIAASEYNIFGAADVAQISAHAQALAAELQ